MKEYFVRYDLRTEEEESFAKSGVSLHPQTKMSLLGKELKFKAIHCEPVAIADCWFFWIDAESEITEFPKYIDVLEFISYTNWVRNHLR
jgi:hypothetical protein